MYWEITRYKTTKLNAAMCTLTCHCIKKYQTNNHLIHGHLSFSCGQVMKGNLLKDNKWIIILLPVEDGSTICSWKKTFFIITTLLLSLIFVKGKRYVNSLTYNMPYQQTQVNFCLPSVILDTHLLKIHLRPVHTCELSTKINTRTSILGIYACAMQVKLMEKQMMKKCCLLCLCCVCLFHTIVSTRKKKIYFFSCR